MDERQRRLGGEGGAERTWQGTLRFLSAHITVVRTILKGWAYTGVCAVWMGKLDLINWIRGYSFGNLIEFNRVYGGRRDARGLHGTGCVCLSMVESSPESCVRAGQPDRVLCWNGLLTVGQEVDGGSMEPLR